MVVVDGVGALAEPLPPVAELYQYKVSVLLGLLAVSGTAVDP